MKLLGSAKKDADKDKDGGDVPKLEVVLVNCNLWIIIVMSFGTL